MSRYVLTRSARRDLSDIWDFIAADNLDAADRVMDALEAAHAARDVQAILELPPEEESG